MEGKLFIWEPNLLSFLGMDLQEFRVFHTRTAVHNMIRLTHVDSINRTPQVCHLQSCNPAGIATNWNEENKQEFEHPPLQPNDPCQHPRICLVVGRSLQIKILLSRNQRMPILRLIWKTLGRRVSTKFLLFP